MTQIHFVCAECGREAMLPETPFPIQCLCGSRVESHVKPEMRRGKPVMPKGRKRRK